MARTKLSVTRGVRSLTLRYQDRSKTFVRRRELKKIQWYSRLRKEQMRGAPAAKLKKSHKFGPWANLSADILHTIMDMLCVKDQVFSSVVCKDWHSAITRMPPPMPRGNYLPWSFYYIWEKSDGNPRLNLLTELDDPVFTKSYRTETPHWKSKTNLAFGAAPCALKDGWFLFAKKYRCKTHFFLHHAFSQRCIWLPTLGYYFDAATFSKSPLSPDCLVFASYHSGSNIYVATCRVGDENWKTMLVDADVLQNPVSSVVFGEEKNEFYCVFPGGILASFAVQDHSWKLLAKQGHGRREQSNHHLLVYEGQLMLTVKNVIDRFLILRFDWTAMTWVMLSNITDVGITVFPDFGRFFSRNIGNGAFFFLNQHYIEKDPKEYWIEPPSAANY